MAYVIAEPCIGTKDNSCVEVCPVDCIHPTPDEPDYESVEMLYIDPNECIDCDACVEACPVTPASRRTRCPASGRSTPSSTPTTTSASNRPRGAMPPSGVMLLCLIAAIVPAILGCGGGTADVRPARAASGPASVVWAVGDGADGGKAADAVVRRIARSHPDRLLYL